MSNNIDYQQLLINKLKVKLGSQYIPEKGGVLTVWSSVFGAVLNNLSTRIDYLKSSTFSYTSLSGDDLDKRGNEFYLNRIEASKSYGDVIVYNNSLQNDLTITDTITINNAYNSNESFTLNQQLFFYTMFVYDLNNIELKPKNGYNLLPVGLECKIIIDGVTKDCQIISSSPYKMKIAVNIDETSINNFFDVTISFFGCITNFTSINTGKSQNQKPNSVMSITGDNPNNLKFISSCIGFTGGSDLENDEHLRERIRQSTNGVISYFSKDSIVLDIFSNFQNITRVGVKTPSNEAEKGVVKVYVYDDGAYGGIVNEEQVKQIKDYLLSIKPASILDDDVIVRLPFKCFVSYKINNFSPKTNTMEKSIIRDLKNYINNIAINTSNDYNIDKNLLIANLITNTKDIQNSNLTSVDIDIFLDNITDNIYNDGVVYEVVND
jgi:hypothetical protein